MQLTNKTNLRRKAGRIRPAAFLILENKYMIIPTDYTEKETLHLLSIIADFADEMQEMNNAIEDAKKAGASQDELDALHGRKFALFNELELKISSHNERLLNKRFDEVKKGGAAAIIKHAKELAEESIGALYVDTKMNIENMQPEEIQKMTGITIKNGELFLTADHAVEFLNHVLYRHIKALADDKTNLRELFAVIIEEVKNSPCTYGEIEIDSEEAAGAAGLTIFKREAPKDVNKYGFMNDLLNSSIIANETEKELYQDGRIKYLYKVDQTNRKHPKACNKSVNTYFALTYFEDNVLAIPNRINAFDLGVLEAISNLFYFWREDHPGEPLPFSCQEVWRRKNGIQNRDSDTKAGPKQTLEIRESIEKLRRIDYEIDITEEIEAKYIVIDPANGEKLAKGRVSDFLLKCRPFEFHTDRGRAIEGYLLDEMPILFRYNELKDHIVFIPFEALDTKGKVRDGENVTEFKFYLLKRIYLFKNGKLNTPKVLLDTIYKDTRIKSPEERIEGRAYTSEEAKKQVIRRIRKADIKKITGILDGLKENGTLQSYTLIDAKGKPAKGNQRIVAFEFTVSGEVIEE